MSEGDYSKEKKHENRVQEELEEEQNIRREEEEAEEGEEAEEADDISAEKRGAKKKTKQIEKKNFELLVDEDEQARQPTATRGDKGQEAEEEENKTSEEKANLLSKLTFWWVQPLLSRGYRRPLQQNDIPPLPSWMRAKQSFQRFEKRWKAEYERRGKNSSFWRVYFKTYLPIFFVATLFRIPVDVLNFVGPIVLQRIILYISTTQTEEQEGVRPPPAWIGYVYALALLVSPIAQAFCRHQGLSISNRCTTTIQTATNRMVYYKSLRVAPHVKQQVKTGEIINLMANDSAAVGQLSMQINELWSIPTQLAVSIFLLYQVVGIAAILAFITM